MTNINLLPWREELREERKKQFLVTLGITVAIAAGLLFLADRVVNARINSQKERNAYLSQQISTLDEEISEIRELQNQKQLLTERMTIIQDLQGTRPVIVRMFDELARTLPDGVYYTTVSRSGNTISLEGIADSNSKVSELMLLLNASDWFDNSTFVRSVAAPDQDGDASDSNRISFGLTVQITRPGQETDENI